MTLVRKLALKISDAVVEYASPWCKEWAEGLAREAAVIESDWSALGWALGSTRVLLDRREAPLGSLADIPAATQKLVEATCYGFYGPGLWLPWLGPLYGLMFFMAKNGAERVGCALVVLSSTFAGAYLWIERRRLEERPSWDVYLNVVACAQFYKAELERAYRRLWIRCTVLLCYSVGMVLALPGLSVRIRVAACGLLWVCAVLMFPLTRRITRRRLEQVESLLAERS